MGEIGPPYDFRVLGALVALGLLAFLPNAVVVKPAAALVGSLLLVAVTAAGLWFAGGTGLGAPIVEAIVHGGPASRLARERLPAAALLGVGVAVVVLVLNETVSQWAFQRAFGEASRPLFARHLERPVWQGVVLAFHAGVTEELVFRLLFVSLFAWLGSRLWRREDAGSARGILWASIAGAAIVFGVAHIPNTLRFVPIGWLVVARAVLLNGIAGTVLGWLYWKRGLEAAIVAHFFGDVVIRAIYRL